MGLRPGAPDAGERAAMTKALEEGALGLSCGLIYPSRMFSPTEELLAIGRGAGVRVHHSHAEAVAGEQQSIAVANALDHRRDYLLSDSWAS